MMRKQANIDILVHINKKWISRSEIEGGESYRSRLGGYSVSLLSLVINNELPVRIT